MKYCGALILVEDVKKARFFYETILGQEVANDYIEDIPFKAGFSLHSRAHFETLIAGRKASMRANNFELYFEDDDLEGLEKRLRANGIEFVHGTEEQPWKQRVMRFLDCDGNIVEVGENMQFVAFRLSRDGMSRDGIARTLYMTEAEVANAVALYGPDGQS